MTKLEKIIVLIVTAVFIIVCIGIHEGTKNLQARTEAIVEDFEQVKVKHEEFQTRFYQNLDKETAERLEDLQF